MARTRRSRAEWSREVGRYRASGQTAEVYAARHGLNVSTLRWWSAEIGSSTKAPAKAQAAMREIVVAPTVVAGSMFELTLGGICLRFEVGTDPRYIASVAAALVEAGRAC